MTQVVSAGAAAGTGHDSSTHASKPRDLIQFAGPDQAWKITLDVDEDQKHKPGAKALEKSAAFLAAGTDLDAFDGHFEVAENGTAVRFLSHLNGANTNTSGYPRTELREMQAAHPDKEASWTISEDDHSEHHLTARVKVTHAPKTPKHQGVVIGQIHQADPNRDLLEIMYDGKKKAVVYRWLGETQHEQLIEGYTLGDWFTYQVDVVEGTVSISIDGHEKMNRDVSAETCSFKAGAYTQSNSAQDGADAHDYGEALFRSIVVRTKKG